MNKMKKIPFANRIEYSSFALEVIHMDVGGLDSNPFTYGHNRYYLLIVNEYSRFSWFYPLISKDQVFNCFRDFQLMIERSITGN